MRSKQEIGGIVEGYARSGMRRREYCEKHGIAITTLDYWRRAHKGKPRLVQVKVAGVEATARSFTLRLANGRSIDCCWRFDEEELARLIRVAERA